MRRYFTGLAVAVLLSSCASISSRTETAEDLARAAGMSRREIPAGGFTLLAYSRIAVPGQPISVYIEGDGLAWLSRTEVSLDPTPTDPVGLRLAAADPAANVVYIARPCQYLRARSTRCSIAYWTDRRFAPEVVTAIDTAITASLPNSGAQKLNLVGFSGGGAIAALLAATRGDVVSLRTVAGNLDHATLNRHHDVDPMKGSLNPIDVAPQLARLPQIHFVGGKDKVVPRLVSESYVRASGGSDCINIVTVPAASHISGWSGWRDLATRLPTCR